DQPQRCALGLIDEVTDPGPLRDPEARLAIHGAVVDAVAKLEERHPGLIGSCEECPDKRCAAAETRQEGRMDAYAAAPEPLAHRARNHVVPADDEPEVEGRRLHETVEVFKSVVGVCWDVMPFAPFFDRCDPRVSNSLGRRVG